MKKLLFLFINCLSLQVSYAQLNQVSGTIVDGSSGQSLPLATIVILDTDIAVLADDKGRFSIDGITQFPVKLIFSYVGFIADTIEVKDT